MKSLQFLGLDTSSIGVCLLCFLHALSFWTGQVTLAQQTLGPYPIYRTISPADGLHYQSATASVQDIDGTYWIGCPVGVQRFVLGAPIKLYRFGDSLAPQTERWIHLLRNEDDSLFAYTGSEVYHYDRITDTWLSAPWRKGFRELSDGLSLDEAQPGTSYYLRNFNHLPPALKGELIGVSNGYLLRYDERRAFLGTAQGLFELQKNNEGNWRSVSGKNPIGLAGISIAGISIDRKGNLFIGTGIHSIIIIHHYVLQNQWLALPEEATEGAWGMTVDDQGKLWVSTRKTISTSNMDFDLWLQVDEKIPVPSGASINDLFFKSDDILLGTNKGLYRCSGYSSVDAKMELALIDTSFVYRIKPTVDGSVDIYAEGKIIHLSSDGNLETSIHKEKGPVQYFDGYRAEDASFWVASVRGLWRADRFGESYKSILPFAEGAPTTFPVLRILKTANEELYFATLDGGLWYTKDRNYIQRISGKGQLERSIYAAEIDHLGRIWMGTNEGLACYVPKQNQWYYFTPDEGYPIRDHNQGASLVMSNNKLVFGGANGVMVFDPDRLLLLKELPSIAISGVALDDVAKSSDWPFPIEIHYGYQARRLDLSFAMLGALDTAGAVPEFRLVGKDDSWRRLRGMRIDLDGLAYGTYTLEARVRDRNTGQVGPVSSTVIRRPPPWYATWWARSLFAFGIIGLVASVWSRIATLRLRRRLEKMELENRINAERVRIARDLHDNVGSTLTYLTTSLRRMKDQVPEKEVETKLNDLQELSQDTLWQLRETIWAASHQQVTLGEFSERLGAYLRRLRTVAEPAALRAILPTEASLELSPGQGLYMFRIVQEALTNAIKYASAKQILVRLEQIESVLELEVSDDGAGFDESRMAYSSGVASIHERAKEMGAQVKLTTSIGKGTEWIVRFPLASPQNHKQ